MTPPPPQCWVRAPYLALTTIACPSDTPPSLAGTVDGDKTVKPCLCNWLPQRPRPARVPIPGIGQNGSRSRRRAQVSVGGVVLVRVMVEFQPMSVTLSAAGLVFSRLVRVLPGIAEFYSAAGGEGRADNSAIPGGL